jgi:SecD/SecF fusion protein
VSRQPLYRALVAFGILAVSLYFALTTSARLGLDLRGGTQIVLETQNSPTVQANAESTNRALEVLRRRVDALGVSEPTLTRSGDRRIIVELPGVQDPRKAAEVIGQTAQLSFHPVLGVAEPEPTPSPTATSEAGDDAKGDTTGSPTVEPTSTASPDAADGDAEPADGDAEPADGEANADGELILSDEGGQRLRLGPPALTGEGVEDAAAVVDTQGLGGWYVTIDFKGAGQRAWKDLTGKAACAEAGDPTRRIAIVLDDQVISSPQVDPEVACNVGIGGGSTQITGNFSQEESKNLSVLIRGGALPVPVEIIEQRTVGPSLGQEAIDASAKAAIIGVLLTGLFIIVVYRLVGALATAALAGYALISYATLVALGATLTLPGLAGFVLAIGMAIDANVLVFERAREEYVASRNKSLKASITTGFAKAWSAIIDSNVTTLLAGGLLFFLASGPVRGFGVTLAIGVLASMISALVVTRVLVDLALRSRAVTNRPGISGISGLGWLRERLDRRPIDLMRFGRRWLSIAGVLMVLAVTGIVVRGLNFGVEFTGGRLVEYSTSTTLDVDRAREAVSAAGFPRAVVQESGENDISVRTGEMTNAEEAEVREALAEAGGGEVTKQRDELIGPSLGDELRAKALIALAVALAAQLIYLAVRFRWTFGAAAVSAMAHDVIILIGVFAWFGKPIDGVFLAALLTVIGYSVNDSVVVFDRVREMWGNHPKTPFPQVVNSAILQTIPRTVNTGLGAMFILITLAVLGGDSLTDFALALVIGIAVGTYSSMFVAGPLSMVLEKRNDAPPPKQKKQVRSAGSPRPQQRGSGAVV